MPWDDRIKRRLKLRDLDIVMVVMQAGSMGKAAERLHMTQSAVSKSVADLEHVLGVRLLDRSRRGVEPTMYGRALDRCGLSIFDDLRQGLRVIEFLADPTAGELPHRDDAGAGGGGSFQPSSNNCHDNTRASCFT